MLVKQKGRKTKGKLVRMWTKRGVGHGLRHGLGYGVGHGLPHGLPYGQPYGLPVVIFFKTRLSIAVNRCKQRAPSMCRTCDSLLFSWRRVAQMFWADSW